jgi:hypothetical protein
MGIFHNMLQHIAASDAQEVGPYHAQPMPMQSWQQAPAPAQVVDHTSQHMRDMHVAVQGLQHQMKQLVALNMLTARPPHAVLSFPTTVPTLTSAATTASTATGPSGEQTHIVQVTASGTPGKVLLDWSTPITCVAGNYLVFTARIQIPTTNTGTTLDFLVSDAINGGGLADAWGAGVQTLDSNSISKGEWISFQWVYLVQAGVTSYAATIEFRIPTNGDKLLSAGCAAARVVQPVIQPDMQFFGATQVFQRNADSWRGPAIPTDTTLSWTTDERVVRDPPAVGSPKAWSCTVSGSPGTWVSEGNL